MKIPLQRQAYKTPPQPKSRLNLQDSGDWTIIDPDAGLMSMEVDSNAFFKNYQLA